MSTHSFYAIQSESASRLQFGPYSLRIVPKEGSDGVLLVISNGSTEQVFDLGSFIVTPFLPGGTLVPYPLPGNEGVIIDTTTLIEAMRLMSEFIVGLHTATSSAFTSLNTRTSGLSTDGTELTITKLNGYRTYNSTGGGIQSTPGPAPWIVGVREDGVAEVGRYLDFHTNFTTGTLDSTCRVTCTGSGSLSLQHLAVTGTLSGPTITALTSKTNGFNATGTELTVTKLNGYNFYGTSGGALNTPGPAPWIVGTKSDGATEIGWMLDFHRNQNVGNADFTCRMTCTEANTLSVPNLAVTGTLSGPTITGLTTRMTNEETKSTSLRTDVDGLTSRMSTAEGTLASHSSWISDASASAAAVNARVTRIMGTYYYPNGYDDPSNKDFRTLEWVVDYMLKNIIPTLGELEGSNTLQSWLLGIFGAASFAEAIVSAEVIKGLTASVAAHGTQLAAHAMTLEANLITMSGMEVDITALKASVTLTAGQVLGLMILGGSIGTGLYLMINRKNGPMTYTEVPLPDQPKYSPVVNDTDPVTLIGYTDPIARIINDVSYEVADARLIKFEGSDARIDPTLRVDTIIVSTLNGVDPSEYALASSLSNYVPNYVLNNYAPKTSVILLMNRVDDIETITNRFVYEDGTTNLHFEYESTFDIDVGDYVPMSFRNDGSVKIDKLLIGTGIYGAVTIKDWSGASVYATINEDGLTVSKINGVDPSEYALVSSLSDYATVSSLSSYALASSLSNYATVSSLSSYALVSSLSDYATVSSLSSYALASSLSNYATVSSLSSYALVSSLSNYATTSSLSTLAGRVTTVETKTTSLSYTSSATTISNALRLPMGQSIDPTNSIVYYGTNVRIEKWWVAPWGAHVNDALILIDHVNTTAYGNEVRMIDGRLNLFRHPGAWSHGVYIDVHLIHFGIETVPQVANINYVSYNTDGTEPHAREPRLALVTHTASSKQYLAIHVPFYVNSGRVHFSGIMSTLSESIPMTMCLPSDGYTIDQSPYDVWSKKQEWNHGLRCIGDIDAPNITTMNSSISSLEGLVSSLSSKTSGLNADGTEITVSKINGLAASDYVTDGALTFLLNGYVPLGTLSDYATTSSLSTLAGRVTTVETKTSGLSANGSEITVTKINGLAASDYVTDGALTFLLNGYVPLGELSNYATTSSLSTLAGRVTTVETKTSGLSADGTEITITKINGLSVSDYAMTSSLSTLAGRVTTVETKTSGLSADGTEITVTKLNGYNFHSGTSGSHNPTAPWIAAVKTDGVMEVGKYLDFRHDLSVSNDYTCRVTCTSASMLNIPNITTGSVTCSGVVTGSNITTMNTKITTLETKTTGLSYSSGTTVFDTVPKIGNESMIDFFYPVGSIYTTSVSTFNPNTKWGGTWVKIEGRVLYGSNSTKAVGDTGGNEKVTIEGRHLPDHTHPYSIHSPSFIEEKIQSITNTSRWYANSASVSTSNTGGWKSVSTVDQLDILPPYEVVNIWKRTA